MPNEIAQRIYDYIKDLPPFVYIDDRDALLRLAARVEVRYQTAGSTIFRTGDQPGDRFFLVREGAVELAQEQDGAAILVERCGEGDTFGIRPLLAEEPYLLTATAGEETLLYAFNTEGFRELLPKYPRLLQYLATSMAGSTRHRFSRRQDDPVGKTRSAVESALGDLQTIIPQREPVTCTADRRIREAALAMTDANVGSIIVVDKAGLPIGVITDRDLRRRVATGRVSPDRLVTELMRGPVVCGKVGATVADVQMTMMNAGINHLALTEDGTDASPLTGVISRHDLMVLQGNNPAVLLREINRAKSATYVRELRARAEGLLAIYLQQEVSIAFITGVMTRINDAIVRRCIKFGLARMQAAGRGNPPALFDWLALGSLGREEQLLRTDQDNALIFEDVPAARHAAVKAYFLELAGYVTEHLHTVGFDYCPGDMMASNPRYCLAVSNWRNQFTEWVSDTSPEALLNVSIFFDYRGVWGDGSLPKKLTEHLLSIFDNRQARFFARLAASAVDNPSPLTFFRNFVVERSGEHKDEFDLKGRAMRPLTDAARVLMLHAKQGYVNNTFRRFALLAELEPQNAELFRAAAEAYETLIRLRATKGVEHGNSGRYLNPAQLTRVQRLLLRNSFEPISEVQTLLSVRFQLNFLR